MIYQHIERVAGGYHYWTNQKGALGWRQIGREFFCVVDDFGDLVPVRLRQKQATAINSGASTND